MSAVVKRLPVPRRNIILPPPPAAPKLHIVQGGLAKNELNAFQEDVSQYEAAGWWSRVAAVVADGFIVGLANLGIGFVVTKLLGMPALLSSIGGMVLGYYYLTYFLVKKNGQTPGKKLMKIRLINLRSNDGNFTDKGQVMGREYFGKLVSMLLIVGYAMPLFRKDKRALHDLMSGTRVIRYS
ncbi:MAG: RDD family protein [Bdellovibrionota bacterium]